MCTIILLHRASPGHGLVVAANRDEALARPSTPPRVMQDDPRVVAGRDETQGGTWMGVSARDGASLFVGITNQRSFTPPDPDKRSRGQVVLDALRDADLDRALERLRGLDGRDYNGFNLALGDGERLYVAYARPDAEAIAIEEVAPGVHVLANDVLETPWPKVHRVRRLAEPHAALEQGALFEELTGLLPNHVVPPLDEVEEPPAGSRLGRELLQALQALCIHTPAYGTRSATLIALDPGRVTKYAFADGPPCQAAFEDYTHLLS